MSPTGRWWVGAATVIACLALGTVLVLLWFAPWITPLWTARHSPFLSQVVTAVAIGGHETQYRRSDPRHARSRQIDSAILIRSDRDGVQDLPSLRYMLSNGGLDQSEKQIVEYWIEWILAHHPELRSAAAAQ